jgi:uncharacterized protein
MNDSSAAKKLIDSGVDLDTKVCGTTALIESIALGRSEITERLVLAGANPNALGGTDDSPLMIASWYCRREIIPLLLAHGAEVNAVDVHGYSPLMDSAQNCQNVEVLALLLRFGARISTSAKDGQTALLIATFYGNEHVVHLLVAAGGDIGAKNENGETALTIARDRDVGCKESHDRIYQFLLTVTMAEQSRREKHPK